MARVCKTDYGQEEAIEVYGHDPRVYQTTVKQFIADKNGNLVGAELVKLKPEKDAKTGRLMMKEVEGSEYKVDVELVLIAAGFLGSENYVTKHSVLKQTQEPMLQRQKAHTRQMLKMCLLQAICTEDSHLLSGRFVRAEMLPKRLTKALWDTQIFN